ncbi:hypothetical protein C6P44_003069 [Monosporozyma unispora]|nr:hypothetical protein C6P44_003069 [Kazachstania unispora]
MDAFNLKKDNRKKFQDKQKLKRRHATQSDLKYRKINKEEERKKEAEETEEDEVPPPLPSNEDRYTTDVLYIPPEQDTQLQTESIQANKIIRKKLSEKESNTLEDSLHSLQIKDPLTSLKGKDTMTLDINSLNKMIGRDTSENDSDTTSSHKEPVRPVMAVLSNKTSTNPSTVNVKDTATYQPIEQTPMPTSRVPTDLKEDEDFLDGLL